MELQGKTAIVTGGARGIGKAICEAYAREGATVIIADILEDEAKQTASSIGDAARAVRFDCTSQESIDALIAFAVQETGRLDILVNNAGIFEMGPVEDVTREQWQKLFAVNAEGLFFTMQAAARQMIRQGQGGKIINLSSQAGRRGEALVSTYCATKACVISLTQSAGLGLIKHGINVNGIAPGVVDTPMWDFVDRRFGHFEGLEPGQKKKMVAAMVPAGRFGEPEDYQGVAVFLASADSDYVVAQTFGVDGGNWMA